MSLPDPSTFESLEALKAREAREADREQIDKRIAECGIDYVGAEKMMYGDLKVPSEDEIAEAQIAEAQEEDPDEILAGLSEGDPWEIEGNQNLGSDTPAGDYETSKESPEVAYLSIDENPFAPIIQRLIESSAINKEQGAINEEQGAINEEQGAINEEQGAINEEQGEAFLLSSHLSGKNTTEENIQLALEEAGVSQNFAHYIHRLFTPEGQSKNTRNFERDKGEYFKTLKGDKDFPLSDDRISELQELIGQYYLVADTPNDKALNMAISIAANDILETHHTNLPRTLSFEVLFQEAKDPDTSLEERLIALSAVLDLANTSTGSKGGKSAEYQRRKILQETLRQSGLEAEFQELLSQLRAANITQDRHRKKEVQEEIKTLVTQVRSGEVFLAGAGDIGPEHSETSKKAA